jgi:hypothetical protein
MKNQQITNTKKSKTSNETKDKLVNKVIKESNDVKKSKKTKEKNKEKEMQAQDNDYKNKEKLNSALLIDTSSKSRLDSKLEYLLSKEYLEKSEIQFNNHLSAIDNQISNSEEILAIQESLFKKLSNINKEITVSDIKLEKFIVRSESEDYYNFIEKYASSLDELLFTLKEQVKEIEMLRQLKEENKLLKTQLEIKDMDKNDFKVISDSKLEMLKNYLSTELNSFSEYVRDFDDSVFFNKFSVKNIDESSLSLYFQNLKVFIRTQMKKHEELKSNFILFFLLAFILITC